MANLFHEGRVEGQDRLLTQMDKAFTWLSEIAIGCSNLEVRLVRVGCLNHQIVKTENTMLVTIPLQSRGPTSQFPLLECTSSSPLFHAFVDEFDSLWELNGGEVAARVGERTGKRQAKNPTKSNPVKKTK